MGWASGDIRPSGRKREAEGGKSPHRTLSPDHNRGHDHHDRDDDRGHDDRGDDDRGHDCDDDRGDEENLIIVAIGSNSVSKTKLQTEVGPSHDLAVDLQHLC